MYQGQLCRIIRRNHIDLPRGEEPAPDGWYLKLKTDDEKNATRFFLIGGNRSIPEKFVDDSMSNKDFTRPYEVIYAASPDEQISLLHLRVNADEFAATLAANERLKTAKRDFEEAKKSLEETRKALSSVDDRVIDTARRIIDEERNLARIEAGAASFMYVYARHPGDEAEFCWRVPYELEEYIHPGVVVKVKTKYGIKRAIVFRIVKHDFLLNHNLVIGVESCT